MNSPPNKPTSFTHNEAVACFFEPQWEASTRILTHIAQRENITQVQQSLPKPHII